MQGARKFDSKFEEELKKGILSKASYHPGSIKYTVEHKYTTDFVVRTDSKEYLIEAKGRFRDRQEATKYVWVGKALKPNQELVFVFYNPSYAMPHAKARKDGTKQTHAEWAERNGFRWFNKETIEEIL